MTTLTEQESSWIAAIASRLRCIQAEAAHRPTAQRLEDLRDALTRSMREDVPPVRRKICLQALLARFPVAGRIPEGAPALPPPAAAPAAVAESPEETLDRFLAAAPALPEERRVSLARRVFGSELLAGQKAGLVAELSEDLNRTLGLSAGQSPRLARLVQLAVQLVELFNEMDQRAMGTMRELKPRSPLLNRPQDFRTAVARYLTGADESLDAQMRAMRAVFGALFLAMLGGGEEFGRQFVERFQPDAIEGVVAGEGRGGLGGMLGPSRKERCWDKYKDLFMEFGTADLVGRRFKDCLAGFVEKRVLGGR